MTDKWLSAAAILMLVALFLAIAWPAQAAWQGPIVYLAPGKLLVGYYETDSLARREAAYLCNARCVAIARGAQTALSAGTTLGPVNLTDWPRAPVTQCDKARLWARDEGARAPDMTRAQKLRQACR